MSEALAEAPVLVVGAGIMGTGIAQVAAQAGHRVWLHDARAGAAAEAHRKLASALEALVAKGRLGAQAAGATLERIEPAGTLEQARDAGLVIEAIVENLDAKRRLLQALEALVPADAVLASNTSSISITALACGLQRPGRVVGMHFFNPVPLMKLVEVVSGLHTDAAVARSVFELAAAWGKTPVHTRSTPGFIVNRIARPYYAEALALLQEQAATPAVLDACLRGAGFRMGPCELMDLIGHDTNYAVTESVYQANHGDKRYAPSLVQREMVDGGLLGRKSGRGFYRHDAAMPEAGSSQPLQTAAWPAAADLVVHGGGTGAQLWQRAAQAAGCVCAHRPDSPWTGLQAGLAQLRLTDGRPALQVSAEEGVLDLALYDLPLQSGGALAWSGSAASNAGWLEQVPQWLGTAGYAPQRLQDAPGLVVARTIAMLVNEACDAVHQGVCTPEGADLAMKLGVNYPAGPFEWLARWPANDVVRLLDHLDACYRGERYRVSPTLRQRAWQATVGPRAS